MSGRMDMKKPICMTTEYGEFSYVEAEARLCLFSFLPDLGCRGEALATGIRQSYAFGSQCFAPTR